MKNAIKKELEARLGTTVEVEEVLKNNGVILTGVSIGTGPARPTIYIDETASVEENVERIARLYEDAEKDIDTSMLTDREYVLNHLRPVLINTDANREMLKGLPHKEWMDLSIIYKVEMAVGLTNMTNDLADALNLTVEDLDWHSHVDAKTQRIQDVLAELMGMEMEMPELPVKMYVLSSANGVYGASAITDANALHEVEELTGWSRIMIIPSSVHEVILIEDGDIMANEMADMIREVNATEVQPDEVLSDHPYIWDGCEVTVA